MKLQTCCCHVCKTSLNQYKREFIPCTQCNKIVCRPCFGTKLKHQTWESANENRMAYICPSCIGCCPCQRCRKKPKLGTSSLSDEDYFKPNSARRHSLTSSPRLSSGSSSSDEEDDVEEDDSLMLSISPPSKPVNHFPHPSRPIPSSEKNQMDWKNVMESINFSKLKPEYQKYYGDQLEILSEKEKRCDMNVKEMQKLLAFMKREKEEIAREKCKLVQSLNIEIRISS
eukprot:TRINITY_DN2793_c0_g1_i1.p1 TRINITY_DN2793_c0_g1~~TRINITY_DN2793_c0_g1_i1.p1  ORF type:complete len:228 (+),score=58.18 TRINITY_DN2793_c0_g1_i1:125-808(+)